MRAFKVSVGRTAWLAALSAAFVFVAAGYPADARVAVRADAPQRARSDIQRVLDDSAAAWSAGDLDRFMTCYARTATTSYVSGRTVVHGYDAIRDMYARRFGAGDRLSMGRLSLELVTLRPLGPDHAYVIGRFRLDRDSAHGGVATGSTTLVFARTGGGWRIVADHS